MAGQNAAPLEDLSTVWVCEDDDALNDAVAGSGRKTLGVRMASKDDAASGRVAAPVIFVAGTSSGVGKTTISCALMAALSARG